MCSWFWFFFRLFFLFIVFTFISLFFPCFFFFFFFLFFCIVSLQFDMTVASFVTSYIMSFIVCLVVEMPFSVIQKLMFSRNIKRTEKPTIYETTESEAMKLSKKIAECEEKNPAKTFAWAYLISSHNCVWMWLCEISIEPTQ